MAKAKSTKIHETLGDSILDKIIGVFLVLFCIIILYPCIYVFSCSFSSSKALEAGLVVLWPVDFSLEAYQFVLKYEQVWVGFRNTLFYCVVCSFLGIFSNYIVAYPLSRRYFRGRTAYTVFFFLTTRISAGLIPTFITRCQLGLFNSIWAIILNSLVAVYSILILRTAINSNVPEDLFDAARIDGASHFQCMFTLAIPLTKAILAFQILGAFSGQWNEYFTSMIYLRDTRLFPIQLVLRPIMTAASARGQLQGAQSLTSQQAESGLENVRYALILITTIPISVVYLFCQKHFKAGVMVGSLKG